MGTHHGHGHGHGHGHALATASARHRRRLAVVLAITLVVLVAEVVGGLLSGSLALLADAGHMVTDAAGLAFALVAVQLAQRPATSRRTWGLARAEVLAAAANAMVLGAVGVLVVVEAVQRLAEPSPVRTAEMLIFGVVGLVGNAVGILLLARASKESLNVRGAFLEVLTDAVASAGVIVAAVVMRLTGWQRVDAVVAGAIAVLIVPRAWRLLREAVDVLLETVPKGIDLDEVRAHILRVPHVVDVHDLHASTVTSGLPVLSVHVSVEPGCFLDGHAPQLLDQVQECIAEHFDVVHSTIQLEPAGHDDHERLLHA
ncbi:cobalt-zinc-cadmium efflux system protein [Kineococcus xinjiangensis]|uniref:Cobalt-zinc-cadmium efflux system protein n=1 Tax=Kineococcus xinjiangensis TaxID=512762 RepID=A0A2S6IF38_9ACTN|nr:cation diffusion facilitator family transporter [Kineococcus xinjiangensis]PPK92835.1 cobalt-zinc-cadmium efflux system protein [Kineococcus xinjiangensis]